MTKVVFPDEILSGLMAAFRAEAVESFAMALAKPVRLSSGNWRLMVRAVFIPEKGEYVRRTPTAVEATPAFRLKVEKAARAERLSIVYCHSHPGQTGRPAFSAIDDESEIALGAYTSSRVVGVPHISLLVGVDEIIARKLATKRAVEVWGVGARVARWTPRPQGASTATFDRQVRAFGRHGQRAIQTLRIAVVGCGGTGSIVVEQLAHLGVRHLLLIDPDILRRTNLNRVVGATRDDVKKPKVDIAKRLAKSISPDMSVEAVRGNVLDHEVGDRLREVDLVFCCTDSHGSRHFLNRLAYQYFVPVIDLGVVIDAPEGKIRYFGGRVQMLAPGLGCLICVDGNLDPRWVTWDLQSSRQKRGDPYFREASGIQQPAVISLNGQTASFAITMFLAAVAGIPMPARCWRFHGMGGRATPQMINVHPHCADCSPEGYLAAGDRYALPRRSK